MKGKKIWGIELSLARDDDIRIPGKTKPTGRYIVFDVRVASRTSGEGISHPGRMFISSKELHRRLPETYVNHLRSTIGNELGRMECLVDLEKRVIQTSIIEPFQYVPGRKSDPPLSHTRAFNDPFARLGLGTRLEQRIEEFLLRYYPGFAIRSSHYTSPLRKMQLEKRGRKPSEAIPLEEATRLSRAHARKNFLKNHIKPPIRPKRK